MMINIHIQIFMIGVEIPLEITVTHLVEVFEFSEIFVLFLDCVVCKMNEFVVKSVQIVFSTAGTYVAVFVEIALELLVDACDKSKNSKIELTFVDEKRVIDVLLNDEGGVSSVFGFSAAD